MEQLISILLELFAWGILAVFLAAILAAGAYAGLLWYRHRNRETHALDFKLLQVAVPRENETKIDAAEQMMAALYSIKKGGRMQFFKLQPHISFEIVAREGDIRFYVAVPENLKDFVEKQIHGAYPGAEIKEVPEYNIFTENGRVSYAWLQLRGHPFFPLKTYKDLPTDPLSLLTSSLAKMGKDEGAIIQMLVSPAENKWRAAGRRWVSKTKKSESDPEKASFKVDPKVFEAVDNKCQKSGFNVAVRIVVSSGTSEGAKMHLNNIKGSFEQFASDLNGFKGRKIRFKPGFMMDVIYRYQAITNLFANPTVLTPDELGTVWHMPNKTVETPHIFWLNAKRAPASAEVPDHGDLYMGKSVFRGIERPVYMLSEDRRRHMYIIGRTGTGKTELLKQMMEQDIKAGHGLAFLDPHGSGIADILTLIPPERAEDVIYFNPSDLERPMGVNLLDARTEQERHFVTSAIIGLMYKLYDPHKTGIIGPRFEHAIRNAMLTVMSDPGTTFVEVVRALTDSNYVQELLPKVQDPIVRRYWTDQIAQTSDFHKSEVLDYIVSKFGRFVTNKMMRNIIGQSKSAFDLREVMDQRKILLVDLSKGELGEENAQFLGLVLVPRILSAAMSRIDMLSKGEEFPDFYLYVDEFQNFATPDFASIMSEARKFKLNLVVANQYISQMEEDIKNAVFGNVGTIISYRVGVTDAQFLSHEFAPTFSETDLVNVEGQSVFVKTIVKNQPVPAFTMNVWKDMAAEKARMRRDVADAVIQLSRLKYGRDVKMVEQELSARSHL
jgi:hypothetical protein